MEDKEIRQKLEQAVELVKNLDKDLKVEAFKILLPRLLNDVSSEIKTISNADNTELNNQKIENTSDTDKEKILADKCGISVEELKDVISIKGEKIEILIEFGGNTTKKQQNAALILLLTNEIIFEKEWTNSRTLGESMHDIGIQDSGGHMAENIKKLSDFIRTRGKSPNLEYKLTTMGKRKASELIKKLAKGEEID